MTPVLPLKTVQLGLRMFAWLVLAVLATWFCFRGVQRDFAPSYCVTYALSLALAWAFGLLSARSAWPMRILVVVITAILPFILLLSILMVACPLMNTSAHGYVCGL